MPTGDPLEDYRGLAQTYKDPRYRDREIYDQMRRHVHMMEVELGQCRQALQLKDKQLMSQQIDKWRTTIEELGKLEALLNECIAHEKNLIGTEGMGWPGRLDQLMGEVARYRETLMRRIANKALERLAPSLETQGSTNGGS